MNLIFANNKFAMPSTLKKVAQSGTLATHLATQICQENGKFVKKKVAHYGTRTGTCARERKR